MSNGNLSDILTPGIVAACADAEGKASDGYTLAASLIPAYSRRHDGADDIASVARVILADVMETTGRTGSDAAATAVSRAAAWYGQQQQRHGAEMLAGDTASDDDGAPRETLNRAEYPAPDRIAQWRERDTLADAWATLAARDARTPGDAVLADVIRDLVTVADVWSDRAAQGGKSPVSVAALAAHRYGADRVTGRNRTALATVVAEALETFGEYVRATLNREGIGAYGYAAPGSDVAHHERATLRDTSTPDSGPASFVVSTAPDGSQWLNVPADPEGRYGANYTRLRDGANVATILARTDALPAHHVAGAARETVAANVAASTGTGRPSRRPAGVSPGIVYGAGHTAGAGKPDARPTASRKRKRDGGVGSPTIPA